MATVRTSFQKLSMVHGLANPVMIIIFAVETELFPHSFKKWKRAILLQWNISQDSVPNYLL